jgi:hypothetical protein
MPRTHRLARPRLWQLAGVVVLALAAVAVATLAVWSIGRPPGASAVVVQPNIEQTPGETTIVVLGDEYATSETVTSDAKPWPQLISEKDSWKLTNLSAGGIGFLSHPTGDSCSPTSCPDILDQVPQAIATGADVVVFAPGTGDVAQPATDLATQMDAAFAAIHVGLPSAVVVVVGPASTGKSVPEILALDGAIQAAATRAGVTYVSLLTPPAFAASDLSSGGKLDLAGSTAIATTVRAAIGTLP